MTEGIEHNFSFSIRGAVSAALRATLTRILRRRSGEKELYASPGKVFGMLMVQYKRGLEVPKTPPFSCKTQLNESEEEKKSL